LFHRLILEKQQEYGDAVIEMAGMPDPAHFLLDVDSRFGIAAVVRKIQGYRWMKSRLPSMWARLRWIACVGAVSLAVVQP
jgi:hypothetical protein